MAEGAKAVGGVGASASTPRVPLRALRDFVFQGRPVQRGDVLDGAELPYGKADQLINHRFVEKAGAATALKPSAPNGGQKSSDGKG